MQENHSTEPVQGNERSFLDQALKHHSSAQTAIKTLQDQLEYLDTLRKSTKENLILKEEKELVESTTDLLSSTQHYLLDFPGNKRSPLSSTLNFSAKPDVSRGIGESVSPIKIRLQPEPYSKDSFASTAFPLTPSSLSYLSPTLMSATKNRGGSLGKDSNPDRMAGLNLTEVLGRLVYGGGSFESDNSINTSDELIAVLEKISRAGQVLQDELMLAKSREAALVNEIQTLRSKKNGYSTHHNSLAPPADADVEMKCRKLENAMLSLQEENLKLNRLMKERSSLAPMQYDGEMKDTQSLLSANQSENKLLRATIDRMKAQLAYYEERRSKQTETSPATGKSVNGEGSVEQLEALLEMEEKVQTLESDLRMARSELTNQKSLQIRIDELHACLLQKEDRVKQCENELSAALQRNKELNEKYEALHHNDVYKRREVLMLCDKFEQMKAKYIKLESEVLTLRNRNQQREIHQTSEGESLRKFLKENDSHNSKLVAEQRELATSKIMLEKDYSALKKRYDDLLSRVSGLQHSDVTLNTKTSVDCFKDGDVSAYDFLQRSEATSPPSRERVSTSPSGRSHRKKSPLRNPREKGIHLWQSNVLPQRHHAGHTSLEKNVNSPSNELHTFWENFDDPGTLCASRAYAMKRGNSINRVAASSTYPAVPRHHSKPSVPQCSCAHPDNIFAEAERDMSRTSKRKSDEYTREMTPIRSRSSLDLPLERREQDRSLLNSTSDLLSTGVGTRRHKRFNTAPSAVKAVVKAGTPPSDTPYANEYLSNMDGVRLLVSLDHNSHCKSDTSKNTSPEKSILRTSLSNTTSLINRNLHKSFDESLPALDCKFAPPRRAKSSIDLTSTQLVSSGPPFETSSVISPESSDSDKSLHLSDLPCDQTTVVDKFRNFDDYKGPPPVVGGATELNMKIPSPAHQGIKQRKAPNKSNHHKENEDPSSRKISLPEAHRRLHELNDLLAKEQLPRRKEEEDASEQTSASTTRDHVGRIEFLRNIQINSGMRLRGVLADTSIREAISLNDSDLDGEVRLGLSDNQEAYADKLVKKYTKKAGKILDQM